MIEDSSNFLRRNRKQLRGNDVIGNRVGSQVIGGASQAYASTAGTNNRLLFDGTFTYAYDNNGNRIARWIDDSDGVLDSGDSDITEYEWDHRNRLTTVTERATFGGAATQTVEYDYDYLNQLVSRTVDADGNSGTTGDITQTKYVYDNGQVVLQFEKTGTGALTASDLSNRYLWGPVVDQLMADEQIDWTNSEANGEVLWALTDHLGTVRDLVNSSGVVQNHKSYDAFGNVTAETNAAIDTVLAFTGKLFDDATGLQNNLNRWYDANVGSWISEDPIGFAGGDANLMRYVGNEATFSVDPSGRIGIGPPGGPGQFSPVLSEDDERRLKKALLWTIAGLCSGGGSLAAGVGGGAATIDDLIDNPLPVGTGPRPEPKPEPGKPWPQDWPIPFDLTKEPGPIVITDPTKDYPELKPGRPGHGPGED